MNDDGFLMLARKVFQHTFWKQHRVFSMAEAWIDMIAEAHYGKEPGKMLLGMRTVLCPRGDILRSMGSWAARWNWTESRVRRFVKLLENDGQVVVKSEGKTTRLTLVNYVKYNEPRRTDDGVATDTRRIGDDNRRKKEGDKGKKGKKKTPPTPKTPRRDEHADAFKTAFDETFPEDLYEWIKADFVQLASWRGKNPDRTPADFANTARWAWAQDGYAGGDATTIRGLCSRWAQIRAKMAKEGGIAPAKPPKDTSTSGLYGGFG